MRSASRTGPAFAILAALALAAPACGAGDIVLPADPGYPRDTSGPGDEGVRDPGHDPGRRDDGGDPADDPGDEPGADGTIEDPGHDGSPDPGTLVCTSNHDPVIEAAELPVALGAAPNFIANAPGTTVDVDVDGFDANGEHGWDFRQGPSDVHQRMFVAAPGDYWFADRFPGATFVSPLSAQDPTILAVYRGEGDTVYLMGVASDVADPAAGRTLAVYESPVPLFAFPLEVGKVYQAETVYRDAVLFGIQNAGRESYTITVDSAGTLMLPDFTLRNTLRLRIEATQTLVIAPSPDPIRTVQFLWVHECMGEVARVMGRAGDSPYQGPAREFRRLGL